MLRIPITSKTLPGKHWLIYYNDDGEKKHLDLSGCACNFSLRTGYESGDDLRAVGWRYEEDGHLCYELFSAGHTVFYVPIKPTLFQRIGYVLSGQNPKNGHGKFMRAFEEALNHGGWKTVERKEQK